MADAVEEDEGDVDVEYIVDVGVFVELVHVGEDVLRNVGPQKEAAIEHLEDGASEKGLVASNCSSSFFFSCSF